MLILSRKQGESIIIGEGKNKVIVKLLLVKGKNAKLGIEATKAITVHREEIYKHIHATNAYDNDDESKFG